MRRFRCAVACVLALLAAGFAAEAQAGRWWCRGPYVAPPFAGAGFAAGYGVGYGVGYGARWGASGWCGPRWGGWCAPSWSGCGPRWGCRPSGWGCPPWYGITNWGYADVVSLSVSGGNATFFSGSIVPYPCFGGWGYPVAWPGGGYGWYAAPYGVTLPPAPPQFGPAGVLPFLGLGASTANPGAGAVVARAPAAARPVIAAASRAAGRPVAVRSSTGIARLRAARLVAVGDRHLRGAQGDPTRLAAALDAYRRAAAIAQDQPDIQLRQALVLTALDRPDQADAAVDRAVAVDGRLRPAAAAGLQAGVRFDPIFDARAGGPPPFAARGAEILREIAAQAGGDAEAGRVVAVLADRWAQRFDRGWNEIAANPAAVR